MIVPRRWTTLSQLQLATAEYEATWWRADPIITSMLAAGEITEDELVARATPRGLTTAAAFRRPDGSWHPTRRSHQVDVVQACLSPGPAEPSPRAVFLTGCPGVGKTSQLTPIALADLDRASDEVMHVAVDRVREGLEGYADGLGSQIVNTEAQLLTYDEVLPLAARGRRHVLFDTIGRVEGSRASYHDGVALLRAAGCRISVLVASAPVDLCIQRAEQRALSIGRIVPPDFQRTVHPEPPLALEALRAAGLVDDWAILDTSGTKAQILDAVPPWDAPDA